MAGDPKATDISFLGRSLLFSSFLLTGATALAFEVVWTRLLLLSMGATAVAVGAVLGAFMGGMAVGAFLAGRPFAARFDPVLASPIDPADHHDGNGFASGHASDALGELNDTPVVRLNRAVAIGMMRGPHAALPLLDALAEEGALGGHHLLHAARADALERLGSAREAAAAYALAATHAHTSSERRYLEGRAGALGAR